MIEGTQQEISEITYASYNTELDTNVRAEDGLKKRMRLEVKGSVHRRPLRDRTVGTKGVAARGKTGMR